MKQPRAPGHPLLWPLSGACAIIALISYNTASVGPLSLLLSTGAGVIALWGFWAVRTHLFPLKPNYDERAHLPDHVRELLLHLKEDWGRQAYIAVSILEQSRSIRTEETMEEGTSRAQAAAS